RLDAHGGAVEADELGVEGAGGFDVGQMMIEQPRDVFVGDGCVVEFAEHGVREHGASIRGLFRSAASVAILPPVVGVSYRIGADENGLGARLGPLVVTGVMARVDDAGSAALS